MERESFKSRLGFLLVSAGWGFENCQVEANTGKGLKIAGWMKYYFRFILPVPILVILIQGLLA